MFCWDDPDICDPGLWCASWDDVTYGPQQTCEDCTENAKTILYDSYGDKTDYDCPIGSPQRTKEDYEIWERATPGQVPN